MKLVSKNIKLPKIQGCPEVSSLLRKAFPGSQLVFTASLLDVQHLKELVWRGASKFACCVLGKGA